MSQVLKIFIRIIHTRIYQKCENQIDQSQFGFRKGVGTREALFTLNILTQRCKDMNQDLYACFINYRKAFDCVQHEKMINILKSTGIDKRDIQIIAELYWNQKAEVKIEQQTTENIEIKKGARQGCVLSPLLYNIYAETIFKEALDEMIGGIKINGKPINNLRYAGDTIIIASTANDLPQTMNALVQHSERYDLYINTSKTKIVIFSKRPTNVAITVNGSIIDQTSNVK